MTDAERREAARQFVNKWTGKGNEDQDSQKYWFDFLTNIVGMENVTDRVDFEKRVIVDGHTKKIDVYIPETHTLIEQKSLGKPLDRKINNSGDVELTPYEQAKRYNDNLPYDEKARWIVTCNFSEIWIYDMNQPVPKEVRVNLSELQSKFSLFDFMVNKEQKKISEEMKVSFQAGKFVGLIYDALLKQYINPENEESLRSLNMLCVRLVFCLYAEDAHIFGDSGHMFYDYMNQFETKDMRKALISLFKTLDTPEDKRDPYDTSDLAKFPYVNGGLFSEENIEIPNFTEEIRDILLTKASEGFNWSDISPTIFGAVFESTLNPDTRRSGGMHYTSIENIHKVIDPLFLNDLTSELEEILAIQVERTKKTKLEAYQERLAALKWLDPACGSGNFLTETFLSIRRLENRVIRAIIDCDKSQVDGQIVFGQVVIGKDDNPIKVSINSFYGIEINDFAVTVAKTALWIAESQMIKETEDIVHNNIDFLPLKTQANIVEGNALKMDWEDVVPKSDLNYIMGNPPFIGARLMEQDGVQKREVKDIFGDIKDVQDLDYVTCWYKLAAEYVKNTSIEVCFVSTNSVCQGSQVPILWNVIINEYGMHINFAYQTFIWDSESNKKAAVHCVIIGFAGFNRKTKYLYLSDSIKKANNISPYLLDGSDSFVTAHKNALCAVPKMNFGNQPRDGGHFVLSDEECRELLRKKPELKKWIRPYVGAEEFIKGKKRWCLWLKNAGPSDIKNDKILYERVQAVKKFREESKAKTTNGYAKVPNQFAQITQPEDVNYLIVPSVSSERRRYVPIGFANSDTISSNAVQIVPQATLFHFGIITSNVHMAWMRTVCGRLKSDYRYSKELVYNTFPWPSPSEDQKKKIEQTAQGILNARALYPDNSLADLYDPLTMPPELRKAHTANDIAVMKAYGFDIKNMSEADCVAELMKMYQKLCEGNK